MRTFTLGLYALIGIAAAGSGLIAVFMPSIALPPDEVPTVAGHLVREQGALFVFVGLMAFWCMRHYEQRVPVHAALFIFTVLFSGIHWAGYFDGGGRIYGAIATTVPVVLLLITLPRVRN